MQKHMQLMSALPGHFEELASSQGHIHDPHPQPPTLLSPCACAPHRSACRLDQVILDTVKGMQLTADGKGAVFDAPSEHADTFLKSAGGWGWNGGWRMSG